MLGVIYNYYISSLSYVSSMLSFKKIKLIVKLH